MLSRFLKQVTAIFSITAFTLAAVPLPLQAFTDVGATTQNAMAINALQEKGILSGYDDGTFKANATVNRSEFLKIILEAKAKASGNNDIGSLSGCFTDVGDQWFAKYVCNAKANGIVSGYDTGDFKPGQPVNFVEAGKMLTLAFGQQVESGGTEWYEPYIRALEASKAITPTINAFDKQLTRGEMAEMMWRLIDKRTDQPTKGYVNIKYPLLAVNMASDDLQQATSCIDLQAFVEESQRSSSNVMMYNTRGMMMDENMGAPLATMEKSAVQNAPPSTAGASADFSKTNVQVQGVDEGDIVKTDGTYLYLVDHSNDANNRKVQIIKAVPGTAMQKMSTVDLGDDNASINELYIDGNILIAIGSSYRQTPMPYASTAKQGMTMTKMIAPSYYPGYYGGNATTLVRTYDITDKANPKTLRSLMFDGSSVSTRKIDEKLYVILRQGMPYWGNILPMAKTATAAEVLPTMTDSARGTAVLPVAGCADVTILPRSPSPSYLVVSAIPTNSATADVKSEVILGTAETVYASLTNLYVGAAQWNYVWDGSGKNSVTTNLYRFAFDGQGVTFKAKGSVPGTVLNQFSMDEHKDTFRIATTVSGYGNDGMTTSNNLFILSSADMKQLGSIEDIAPGESIKSVRFMGDRAYMVTFEQIDPLFVIDTADARNPKILGKLKIPGYSDYLEPYDETHLIGFGKEVDASIDADKVHTPGAVYYTAVQGMKMSIFDVSDVAHPTEMFKTVIGDRGTDSPVLTNHHALLFEKDKGLLTFPITVYTAPTQASSASSTSQSEPVPTFQGAYVYNIGLTKGFELKGKISHYGQDDYMKSGGTWYPYGKDIERIVRINDSLYTISQSEVDSHTLSTLTKQGSVSF